MSQVRVALLRAVNVGGRMVAMAELKALAADLGLGDPRTLLQSGNLVFRADTGTDAELEARLETAIAERLGVRTDVHVRGAADLDQIIARNPFPKEAESDPGHLLVMFLKSAPPAAAVEALQAAVKGRETVRAAGRQAYIVYPDGVGQSKLTNAVIERHVGGLGTGRNWNTVLKLAAAVSA